MDEHEVASAPARPARGDRARAVRAGVVLWVAAQAFGCALGVLDPAGDGAARSRDARARDAVATGDARDATEIVGDGGDAAARAEGGPPGGASGGGADAGGACVDRDGDGHRVGPLCGAQDCDDGDPSVHPGAAETCNGRDDNCNGAVDEALGERTCGAGACRRTVPACVAGAAPPCVAPAAAPETCNGLDEDCDGRIDNGLRAYLLPVSYRADLAYRSPLCDGDREAFGAHCAWAAHRQCANVARRACCTAEQRESGFGPVERDGDHATLACVATTIRDLAGGFGVLSGYAPGCDGRPGADGACAAAAHRYCVAQHYVSGFGPINVDPVGAIVSVACVGDPVATLARVPFAALDARAPGCAAERYGPRCASAVHRHCAAAGFATGFGPVDAVGDVATVACVTP